MPAYQWISFVLDPTATQKTEHIKAICKSNFNTCAGEKTDIIDIIYDYIIVI